jgi:hypothetical protein
MDMTNSIIPKSDQINADDLVAGPRTVTIEKVSAGSAEQPVDVHLREFPGRAFRPSKSMRRVMVAAWGAETNAYTGKRMTLYREASIKFGSNEVGGIRISHMSGIDKPLKIALTVTRGKREPFTVAPLLDKTVDKTTGEIINSADRPSESVYIIADRVTPEQTNTIGALLTTLGMNDSAIQLAYVGDVVEHSITSPNQLTHGEADRVIAYLQKDVEQMKSVASEANGDE